jgi:hypothetical protein
MTMNPIMTMKKIMIMKRARRIMTMIMTTMSKDE